MNQNHPIFAQSNIARWDMRCLFVVKDSQYWCPILLNEHDFILHKVLLLHVSGLCCEVENVIVFETHRPWSCLEPWRLLSTCATLDTPFSFLFLFVSGKSFKTHERLFLLSLHNWAPKVKQSILIIHCNFRHYSNHCYSETFFLI